jgi:hypothetical protein
MRFYEGFRKSAQSIYLGQTMHECLESNPTSKAQTQPRQNNKPFKLPKRSRHTFTPTTIPGTPEAPDSVNSSSEECRLQQSDSDTDK